MSEGQLKALINATNKVFEVEKRVDQKLGRILEKSKEELVAEKEGNLIEQRGNYIGVSYFLTVKLAVQN